MWIDDSKAKELQQRHLSGDKDAIGLLYLELRKMAAAILKSYRVHGSIEDMAHDAATNLISSYMRHSGWHLTNGHFIPRMRVECKNVMRGGSLEPRAGHKDAPITRARREEVSYEKIYDNEIMLAREETETCDAYNIRTSGTPVVLGGGVATISVANFLFAGSEDVQLLDGLTSFFAHYSWYRPAIRKLSEYVSKRFLLDHAVEVRRIFREARKK